MFLKSEFDKELLKEIVGVVPSLRDTSVWSESLVVTTICFEGSSGVMAGFSPSLEYVNAYISSENVGTSG